MMPGAVICVQKLAQLLRSSVTACGSGDCDSAASCLYWTFCDAWNPWLQTSHHGVQPVFGARLWYAQVQLHSRRGPPPVVGSECDYYMVVQE